MAPKKKGKVVPKKSFCKPGEGIKQCMIRISSEKGWLKSGKLSIKGSKAWDEKVKKRVGKKSQRDCNCR